DPSLVAAHYVQLVGLTPETVYHYRVRSQNSRGQETISPDYTFTTKATASTTYTLTATFGTDGTITPNGIIVVAEGANQTFTMTADAGYEVEEVLVDEVPYGPLGSYTFNNVTAHHSIHVTFTPTGSPTTHSITATAGANGDITPSGVVTINQGSNQNFTFTADPGYEIENVRVDNISLGSISSYTFTAVSSDHTIAVSFARIAYTITAAAAEGGVITPSGPVPVWHGAEQQFMISADAMAGYHIADVLVDGVSQGTISTYNFTDVTNDHTISAEFALDTYTITTQAGQGGTITPAGPLTVQRGDSQAFTILADPGYRISEVIVDGVSRGNVSSYTFTDIQDHHSLNAAFVVDNFIISAGASEGGSITPGGEVAVLSGADQEFIFLADPGYRIGEIVIDGASLPNPASYTNYTFSNVNANYTIDVNYRPDAYIISATTDQGGIISPPGNITVESGAEQEFTFSTHPDYHLVNVLIDGSPHGPITSYTFTNVVSDHHISVITATGVRTISATANEHGTIEPSGDIQVPHGTDLSFVITPENDYYCVADVLINGIPQGARTSYTFHDIIFDYTIEAVFALKNLENTDTVPPLVTNYTPNPDIDFQTPLNTIIVLHVIDQNSGVNADSVTIAINDTIVYSGDQDIVNTMGFGRCQRIGTETDYTFIFQPNLFFDFDQEITVTVVAQDQAGNTMPEFDYSFRTEMRSFGENLKVNTESSRFSEPVGHPATALDSDENVWVAWHLGAVTRRDIYISKLTPEAAAFEQNKRIIYGGGDQCNPVIAIDADNTIHLAWQDNQNGNWDIYYASSVDGINWSAPLRITDSDDDQTNPVIALDDAATPQIYIAWQDMINNNWDIYLASSGDRFATKTTSPITTDYDNQIEPALTIDADNNVYLVWTDYRNGNPDIFGASSHLGDWNNHAVISNARHKSSPAIACESQGNILHLLWVEQINNDKDIYYANTAGIPSSPIIGANIVDDSSNSDQWAPTLLVKGHTGNHLKVFAAWQDHRNNIDNNGDSDIYFAEAATQFGANIFIPTDTTLARQSQPILALGPAEPYLIWTDNRTGEDELYYAATTYIKSDPIASGLITAEQGGIVGTDPSLIVNQNDISVEIPANALRVDTLITISKIKNPPAPDSLSVTDIIAQYEFGPSWNIEFFKPVIITIPYSVEKFGDETALWYNPQTGQLSDSGITNIEHLIITDTLHAIRFKTTHFTRYVVALPAVNITGSGELGGGSGGCSISRNGPANGGVLEFVLPYFIFLTSIWIVKRRDTKNTA
ncbi:MAG: hypothetical protein GY869_27050, partial [Planctomycetes bacterium]|nr:hypothetical protein [Planctomycetota bacterium]